MNGRVVLCCDRTGEFDGQLTVWATCDWNQDGVYASRWGANAFDEDVTRCFTENSVEETPQYDVAPSRSSPPSDEQRVSVVHIDCSDDSGRNIPRIPHP